MDRRDQVKALGVTRKDIPRIEMWALGYIGASHSEKKDYRHYGSSWSLDPELMVLNAKSCGEHYADVVLPLDGLRAYLDESRKLDDMIQMFADARNNYMEKMIAEVFEAAK